MLKRSEAELDEELDEDVARHLPSSISSSVLLLRSKSGVVCMPIDLKLFEPTVLNVFDRLLVGSRKEISVSGQKVVETRLEPEIVCVDRQAYYCSSQKGDVCS